MVQSKQSRQQLRNAMHQRYHQEAHKFFNNQDLRRSRAGGQSATKTRNGFSLVVPPTAWIGIPPTLRHDPTRPPYTPVERRMMHHGIYHWD